MLRRGDRFATSVIKPSLTPHKLATTDADINLPAIALSLSVTSSPAEKSGAWLPPLRFSLPVIMLIFGLVLICVQTALFLTIQEERAVSMVTGRAQRDGPRLARLAGQYLAFDYRDAVRRELQVASGESGVHQMAICGVDGGISEEFSNFGPEGRTEEVSPQEIRAMVSRAIAAGESQIGKSESGTELLGVFPFEAGSADNEPRALLMIFDLAGPMAEARNAAWLQALLAAGVLALGSLLLWLALDSAIARRAERIVAAARVMAQGQPPGPPIGGQDELAHIDQALREAHDLLGRQAVDLRARAEQIEEKNRERRQLEAEIIEISERERRRIGQDLHDDVCQRLAAVKMKVQDHEERLAESSPALVDEVGAIADDLDDAIHIARSLARGLSPVDIESGGIAVALGGLAKSSRDVFGVDCRFETDDQTPPLPRHAANQLYRIAQECIANAAKHAKAHRVIVSLKTGPAGVVLRVSNDGLPMPSMNGTRAGMGMPIMRYRAESVGAVLDFDTAPPDATTAVRCTLPLQSITVSDSSAP